MRDLAPGYFAFVMATGIVSIAAQQEGWDVVSTGLFWVAVVGYVVLVVLNLARLLRHRAAVARDLRSPSTSFGFFTFVAGTAVLGTKLCLDGHVAAATVLLAVAAVSVLVLGYAVPTLSFASRAEGPLMRSADGTWFVWVVAFQSVAVLSAGLEAHIDDHRDLLALMAVACWAIGVFLYGAVGMVVAIRLLRYRLEPADLTAPYWVGMGATAITVVAGSTIIAMSDTPTLAATGALVTGLTVLFWAWGTWLIPPLLIAGYWRHVRHRVPLRYELGLWSIVFPLGMYGVGSHDLGHEADLPLLVDIGRVEVWVATLAWAATFVGLLIALGGSRRRVVAP